MNRLFILLLTILLVNVGCDGKQSQSMLEASPQSGELIGSWKLVSSEPSSKNGLARISFCDESWLMADTVTFRADGYVTSTVTSPITSGSKCVFELKSSNTFDLDCSGRGLCYATMTYTISDSELEIQFNSGNNKSIPGAISNKDHGTLNTIRLKKTE